MSRAGDSRRWLVAAAITAALFSTPEVASADASAAAEAERLAWVEAEDTGVVPWPDNPWVTDGGSSETLRANQWLVVPARPGERVRFRAEAGLRLETGLASLRGRWLSSVTRGIGHSSSDGTVEVIVPSWSSFHAAIARIDGGGGEVAAEVASRPIGAAAWAKFVDDLCAWIADDDLDAPPGPTIESEQLVRLVEAIRTALGDRAREADAVAWLTALAVDASLRQRPLVGPWFVRSEPAVTGGGAVSPPAVAGRAWQDADWQTLDVSRPLGLVPEGAEVLQVAIVPSGTAPLELEVLRGGAPLRRALLGPGGGARRVTLRIALPPSLGDVSIVARRGRGSVAVRAYTQRPVATGAPRLASALDAVVAARPDGPFAGWAKAFRQPHGAVNPLPRPAVGTGPGAAALHGVLSVDASRWSKPERAREVANAAWSATQGLPDALRVPLQLRLLSSMVMRGRLGEGAGVPVGGALSLALDDLPVVAPDGVDPTDVEAARALAAALSPRRDGARPSDAMRASAFAATASAGAVDARNARSAWLGEGAYRSVAIRGPAKLVDRVSPVPVGDGSSRCALTGGAAVWAALEAGEHAIEVAPAVPGTHQILALRGPRSVSVDVDGVSIPVHAVDGATSRVAVRPGKRTLTIPAGASVLARVSRLGDAPCGELRELERWYEAQGSVWVDVPGAGTETSLRLSLSALPGAPEPVRLEAASGRIRGEVWAGEGEPAVLEVPVPASVTRVELRLPKRAMVRASARMRAHAPSAVVRATTDEAVQDALGRVRRASVALAMSDPAERADLRLSRATALSTLGYARYADLDRAKAGAVTAGGGGVLPSAVAPPVLAADALDVVAMNVSASVSLPGSADLEAALQADRQGDEIVAADAYRQLARAHRSPHTAMAAARRLGALALAQRDAKRALEAYAWAKQAESDGANAAGLVARLAPSIQWVRARAAGPPTASQWVDTEPPRGQEAPLSTQVRRAYLAAPDDSVLIAEGRSMTARVSYAKTSTLWFEARCVDVSSAPAAPCRMAVAVDGREVQTKAGDRKGRRTFEVPSGPHRLDVSSEPSDGTMAWVRLARIGDEKPLPSRVRSKWFVAKQIRPTELTFAGPTVLRVTARPESGAPNKLVVKVNGRPGTTISLSGAGSVAVREEFAVLPSGTHRLRIAPDQGAVLVRLHLAGHGEVPPPSDAAADRTGSPRDRLGLESHDDGFGTLSLRLRGVARFTDDEDDAGRDAGSFFESQLALRRELWPRAGYFYVAGLVRPRDGPVSYGGRARLDVGSGLWPRLYAKGQLMAQDQGGASLGTKVAGALHWRAPLSSSLSFAPLVGIDVRDLDTRPAGAGAGADPDVFSAFDAARPRSLFGSLALTWRPTIDSVLRVRGGLRTNEFVEEVDRVHVTPAILFAPGRGLAPIASASYTASYRLAGDTRSQSFLRHLLGVGLSFFDWVADGHRISLTGRGRMAVVGSAEFSAWAGLGWDFAAGRGARDFAPHETPFRHRLEEGSGRVRRRGATEPRWLGEDDP